MNAWSDFGIAGLLALFALQVIREVLALVRARVGGRNGAGEQSIEFWRSTNEKLTRDALAVSVVPILDRMARVLDELRHLASLETERSVRFEAGLAEVQKTLDRHDARGRH